MPPFAEGDLVRCGCDCVQGRAHFAFLLGREVEVVLYIIDLPPHTILLVYQAASPCLSFFVEIGSLRRTSFPTFDLKTLSVLLKIWQSVCLLSVGRLGKWK